MPAFRSSARTNRSGRLQVENDVFEGLPVRQWRQSESTFGLPQVETMAEDKDLIFPELPMPRDSNLLSPFTQQLLREARKPRTAKRKAEVTEEEKPEDDDELKNRHVQSGWAGKKWSQLARHLEEPEREFLAKRRKGLPSAYSEAPAFTPQVATRKAKIIKSDATGKQLLYDVIVPEGATLEGEVKDQDISGIEAPALAPGTIIEGVGVANAEGQVVAHELLGAPTRRRKPPPPKRKGGPGRGRKKVVIQDPAAAEAAANGSTSTPATADGTTATPATGTDGNTNTGEGDEEEGEDDGEEGEDGEEGDEEGDDDDKEDGELSDPEAPTAATTPAPSTLPAQLESTAAITAADVTMSDAEPVASLDNPTTVTDAMPPPPPVEVPEPTIVDTQALPVPLSEPTEPAPTPVLPTTIEDSSVPLADTTPVASGNDMQGAQIVSIPVEEALSVPTLPGPGSLASTTTATVPATDTEPATATDTATEPEPVTGTEAITPEAITAAPDVNELPTDIATSEIQVDGQAAVTAEEPSAEPSGASELAADTEMTTAPAES